MNHGPSTSDVELHPLEGQDTHGRSHSLPDAATTALLPQKDASDEHSHLGQAEIESRAPSTYSAFESPLLPKGERVSPQPNLESNDDGTIEPRKTAIDGKRWVALLRCISHLVPLLITIGIISLNATHVYWQDLGRPNQNLILQAWQYAAKAHELLIVASLTSIALHRIQYGMAISQGVPLGFVSGAYQFSDPMFILSKDFIGGITARTHPKGVSKLFPLGFLLLIGVVLTAIVGPSSAVVMIPQLDWYNVPNQEVYGDVSERIYFNHTAKDLWPADITNDLYNKDADCVKDMTQQDCAVAAVDIVRSWVSQHQNQGLKPNLTITQDGGVTRFLTSVGGPYDNNSWTVASTVGYQFARDLGSFWEWMVQRNSRLARNISRPLITPSFVDPAIKLKKPLVQGQCKTYFNPDWNNTKFEFPHHQLKTPPLDKYLEEVWSLPNDFVTDLLGNNTNVGLVTDKNHPRILFDWYDTAGNFSQKGAPSLGAVVIFSTTKQNETALAACSFDGRWAPVSYYLDPKTDPTIRQDSPDPMDILKHTNKDDLEGLIQMKMHLDWAATLNLNGSSDSDPLATTIEQLFESLGNINAYNHWAIYNEAGDDPQSLAWRISTVLGLVLTEGLARAYRNGEKGSVVFHNGTDVRRLDNLNGGNFRGYRNNTLDFVVPSDAAWNSSVPSWDVWAPANGYTEMKVSVQRYGYGYSFNGTPIKLATVALLAYALLAFGHMVLLLVGGRTFNSWGGMGEILALAWNSVPTQGLRNTSAGIEKVQTWRQVVRVREGEGKQLQLVLGDEDGAGRGTRRKPRVGVEYA